MGKITKALKSFKKRSCSVKSKYSSVTPPLLTGMWVVVDVGITQVLISQELAHPSHRYLGLLEVKMEESNGHMSSFELNCWNK